MTLQISKNIGIDYCLNCTAKINCDGTVDSLCPIFINRSETKKEVLKEKIEVYTALDEYLEFNGPMTTREIIDKYEIPRTKVNNAIRRGLLKARSLSKEEKMAIKGGVRGRFAYLILAVDLSKL